jgi:hypothetical protein
MGIDREVDGVLDGDVGMPIPTPTVVKMTLARLQPVATPSSVRRQVSVIAPRGAKA